MLSIWTSPKFCCLVELKKNSNIQTTFNSTSANALNLEHPNFVNWELIGNLRATEKTKAVTNYDITFSSLMTQVAFSGQCRSRSDYTECAV